MSRLHYNAIFWVGLGLAPGAFSQKAEETTQPNIHIIDWTPFSIEPEIVSRFNPALKIAKDRIVKKWAATSKTLVAATEPPTSLNQAQLSQTVQSAKIDIQKNHIVMPIWCALKTDYVFLLRVVDANSNLLLAQDHFAIAKTELAEELRGDLSLKIDFDALLNKIQNQANNIDIEQMTDENVFKLGLSLARESKRLDTGSYRCLNLLAEEQLLAKKVVVVNNHALETLFHIRMRTKLKTKIHRSTRTALIDWQLQPQANRYRFSSNMSESILGNRFQPNITELVQLTRNNRRIELTLPAPFIQQINDEKAALTTRPYPKIAHIYGAWVYLDRGRGYGLKMNDRLEVKALQGEIKGHVVGFFGPHLNLKSPRGHTIREGAIVFIRKGQRKTNIGQELVYDTKRYPTPWPPQ